MLGLADFDWRREPNLREKAFFGIIFVLCLFMVVRVWWAPQQAKIKRLKTERTVIELQAIALEGLIEATKKQVGGQVGLAQMEKIVDEGDQRAREILSRVSSNTSEQIALVLHTLTGRRMLGGLVFRSVKVGEPEPAKKYTVIPLKLNVVGTFNGVQRYVKRVEKIKRPIVVGGVQMEQGRSRSGIVNAELTVYLYTHKVQLPVKVEKGAKK